MSAARNVHRVLFAAAVGLLVGLPGGVHPARSQEAARRPKPPAPSSATAQATLEAASAAIRAEHFVEARALLAAVPQPAEGADPELEAHRLFHLALIDQLEAERGEGDRAELLTRAAESYSRALALDPKAVGTVYNLGRVYQMLGDVERADAAYKLAVEHAGRNRVFYLRQRADFLAGQQRWAEAEPAYEEVVTLDPAQEAPHRILLERYLARREDPDVLVRYVWRLYGSEQYRRAEELALDALERGWPPLRQPELLTAVAASLGRAGTVALDDPASADVHRRVARLAAESPVAEGARQLRTMCEALGTWPLANCSWWNRPDLEWAEQRGVARRDAIRAVLRAGCSRRRDGGKLDEAAACYRNALEDQSPDPIALRELAGVYVAQGRIDALDGLAARYADPRGALFAAKNEAYRRGQLETVLQYHRTLGQIYGNLARNGKATWGDTATPTTALFQLSRAFEVGKSLDDTGKRPTLSAPPQRAWIDSRTHVDPAVAVLLAEGYQAMNRGEQANGVRLEAAERFERAGDARARDTVLKSVKSDTLTTGQRSVYERFVPRAPVMETPIDPKIKAKMTVTPAEAEKWNQEVGKITMLKGAYVGHHAQAGPKSVDVRANVEWVDTGVDVAEGQSLNISATGQWSNSGPPAVGANGWGPYDGTVLAGAPIAALIGRVGDRLFLVGAAWGGRAPAAGRLYLGINDTSGTYGDNQGSLAVIIHLE